MTLKILTRLPVIGRFFRKADPTPEDVREYWKAAHARWGTVRINKADAAEMKMVAELLGLLGIVDKRAFMQRFTTTFGNRIYTPFEPGVILPEWPLWEQIKIGDHEHIHVHQDHTTGGIGFEWDYTTNPAQRAHWEAQAYRSEFVLEWRFNGRMPDAVAVASVLGYYGCSTTDVAVTATFLQRSIPSIKAGAIANDVTRWTVQWLEDRWRYT